MKKLVLPICIVALGITCGVGMYLWQKGKADLSSAKQTVLRRQVLDAQKKYDAAVATSEIKTDAWKQYCDPVEPFCFKYPTDWVLEDSVYDFGGDDKRVSATLTSPNKTASVRYMNPLIKDGSSGSAHIVDVSEVVVSGQKIKLIGSFPVSSGRYTPRYIYAASDSIAGGAPGTIGHDLSSSLFTIGKYSAISFSGGYSGSEKITSQTQAEAWFHSLDGKTTKAILDSLSAR